MFKHVLVPLDGSAMAEAALPAAARLAELLGAEVTLLHAIERNAPETVHGEPHLGSTEEAEGYLEDAVRRAFPAGARVACHVHRNEVEDVARSIAEHAGGLMEPLIVMCTHGRGGLANLLLGNIAQRVVEFGTAPVLLVPPHKRARSRPFRCARLLVPLDGTEEHEGGIEAARELGRACRGALHLLLVVPTRQTLADGVGAAGRLLPGTAAAMLEMAREDASAYLDRHAANLRSDGLEVTMAVRRGDPARTILASARSGGVDIIVLAVHRRTGMQAFWAGSVGRRVASYAMRPVLLVPVRE